MALMRELYGLRAGARHATHWAWRKRKSREWSSKVCALAQKSLPMCMVACLVVPHALACVFVCVFVSLRVCVCVSLCV